MSEPRQHERSDTVLRKKAGLESVLSDLNLKLNPGQSPNPDLSGSSALMLFYQSGIVLPPLAAISIADNSVPDISSAGHQGLFWTVDTLAAVAGESFVHTVRAVIPVDAGQGDGAVFYALELDMLPESLSDKRDVMPVRQLLMERGFEAFSLAGRASQWLNWYRTHRYCGACGGLNQQSVNGRVLHCPQCEAHYYPRINPCVIVLVTDGDRILLARSNRRGAAFFSCLAGFIEPGETAEEAVAREVYEEAGIQVRNIRYIKSQPWPFPSQLMLGFYADYAGGELNPCPEELAEAGWFDVGQLPPTPAPAISVAGQLIADYCHQVLHSKES